MDNSAAIADLKLFGAPEEVIAPLRAQRDDFHVLPDNWDTVQAFISVQTQWKEGYAGPTGLDYNGVSFAFEMMGLKGTEKGRAIFEGLQLMEVAALKVFREKD